MILDYQIKMIDDLIAENRDSTVKDFVTLLKDIQALELEVTIRKIIKTEFSGISVKKFLNEVSDGLGQGR